MKEYSLAEHLEVLKAIPDVFQVYITEPDYQVYQQIGDIPSVAFNVESNSGMTFTLVVPNEYWKHNTIERALEIIPQWLKFLETDPQGRTSTTFNFRPNEGRVVQLKGSLKIEEMPPNAQLLADELAKVEHVVLVKVRRLIDPFQLGEDRANCQNAFQYYCQIDIRTGQSVPAINLYVPERYWDNPEEHFRYVDSLKEQIQIRMENSKNIFGEENMYV
jgi:uncharacterized pyridoxamine 5'-phosphate oxidase family protein